MNNTNTNTNTNTNFATNTTNDSGENNPGAANRYPFPLVPLPYAYNALEPYIDEKTMHLHHDRHLQTYVNNLNAALAKYPQFQNWTLEQLLYYSEELPGDIRTAVINNGGGVYNHNFYFANMSPAPGAPGGDLLDAIVKSFGSVENFENQFKAQALAVFGSGYTWLALGKDCNLKIINTKNQDTVLPLDAAPIMGIDVWEHAYYLKHYNVRADYIADWFRVADWRRAQENYEKHAAGCRR